MQLVSSFGAEAVPESTRSEAALSWHRAGSLGRLVPKTQIELSWLCEGVCVFALALWGDKLDGDA